MLLLSSRSKILYFSASTMTTEHGGSKIEDRFALREVESIFIIEFERSAEFKNADGTGYQSDYSGSRGHEGTQSTIPGI